MVSKIRSNRPWIQLGLPVKKGKGSALDLKAQAKLNNSREDEEEGGSQGSQGSSGRITTVEPFGSSFLVEDSTQFDRARRLLEQEGERQFARVHARTHSESSASNGPEGELQNSIAQHPYLDSQRFDGIDPNLNPEPPLNSEARREFDNQRREQEMEKQLRLGNMPKFSSAPKPSPQ